MALYGVIEAACWAGSDCDCLRFGSWEWPAVALTNFFSLSYSMCHNYRLILNRLVVPTNRGNYPHCDNGKPMESQMANRWHDIILSLWDFIMDAISMRIILSQLVLVTFHYSFSAFWFCSVLLLNVVSVGSVYQRISRTLTSASTYFYTIWYIYW